MIFRDVSLHNDRFSSQSNRLESEVVGHTCTGFLQLEFRGNQMAGTKWLF